MKKQNDSYSTRISSEKYERLKEMVSEVLPATNGC